MITQDDLTWWLKRAEVLDWTSAKTYADTAPHDYVVEGRTKGLTREEYVRAGRVIHTFGSPAKFYKMTKHLHDQPRRAAQVVDMDADVAETSLINRATTDRLYGVQNAPPTQSGIATAYDSVATEYDTNHPTSPEFAQALRSAVAELSGDHTPAILDIGCGTGRVLDLELTRPDRYAGVDPSTPMVNQLVRKNPNIGAVYPMTIEQAVDAKVFTPGQFEIVTVLLSESEQLDPIGDGSDHSPSPAGESSPAPEKS